MELTIAERVIITNLLPEKGNITDLRIVRDLARDLGFSEAELAEHKIREEGGGVAWAPESSGYTKDVPMGTRAVAIVREQLEARDRAKALTFDLLPLYERFVDGNVTDLRAVS